MRRTSRTILSLVIVCSIFLVACDSEKTGDNRSFPTNEGQIISEIEKRDLCPIQRPPGSVSVVDYGAIPDDDSDDRQGFQKALDDKAKVWVPRGAYDLSGTLKLNDSQYLAMHCDAILNANDIGAWGEDSTWKPVLKIEWKDGVTIEGGVVDGHDSETYSKAFGLFVLGGSTNISVSTTVFQNMPGDGVNIHPTDGGTPSDITLDNVFSLQNYRTGLVVTGGTNIDVLNGSYSYQVGENTGAGIDLEPISSTEVPISDVLIENVRFLHNGGPGLKIQPSHAAVENITVVNNTFKYNLQAWDPCPDAPPCSSCGGPWAVADGIFTFGDNVEVLNNTFYVHRRNGIIIRQDAGDTDIEDNLFIGTNDSSLPCDTQRARWAIFRMGPETIPGPHGTWCRWKNRFEDKWVRGHYPTNRDIIEGPCE